MKYRTDACVRYAFIIGGKGTLVKGYAAAAAQMKTERAIPHRLMVRYCPWFYRAFMVKVKE